MCAQTALAAIERDKKVTWAKVCNCTLPRGVGNHILLEYHASDPQIVVLSGIIFAFGRSQGDVTVEIARRLLGDHNS